MDVCPKCTKMIGSSVICPHCGANTAFYDGPEMGPGAARKPELRRRSYEPERRGFPVVWLTLVLFVIGLAVWYFLPVRLADLHLTPAVANAGGIDPCLDRSHCVLVYVAPWCPACKRSIGTIRGLMSKFNPAGKIGIKAVIGGRNPKKMETMAAEIGPATYLDTLGRFWASTGAKSIPHWFVIDDQGYVVKKFPGAIPNVDAMSVELGLDAF